MRDRIDPAVAAELAAVDAALEGGRDDPDVRAIRDEVRARAARMTPAFTARLEQAARDGFAARAPGGAPRRRPRRWTTPRLSLAAGALAAVAVAIAVAAGSGGGGGQDTLGLHAPRGAASPGTAAGDSAAGAGSSAGSTTIAPGPAIAQPVPATRRRVERAAQLTVAVPVRALQRTVDDVAAVADRLGGFVATSDVAAGGRSGEADFDLRVPVGRLDEALAAISRLGHVRARSSQVRDVTASYASARGRLHDAQAGRAALLRALARATTQPEIDSLRARLAIARREIDTARAALHTVRRRAALARVAVTVLGVRSHGAAAAAGSPPWTPARALHTAVRVLATAAGVAIVALAAALPPLVLALLGALGWRWATRRRRERALDTSSAAV